MQPFEIERAESRATEFHGMTSFIFWNIKRIVEKVVRGVPINLAAFQF